MAVIPIALLGGGGHASDLLGVLAACNQAAARYRVLGIFDDTPQRERFSKRDIELYPDVSTQLDWLHKEGAHFISAIGYPELRMKVAADAHARGLPAVPAIFHPGVVYVGEGVTVGEGSVVHAGVSLSACAKIGRHCYISHGALIGHDSVIGDGAAIMPGATLSGDVTLGKLVMVGSGAVILPQLSVGDNAQIGANAVVTRDVPAGVTVMGIPARQKA